jgi:hypothetical protein
VKLWVDDMRNPALHVGEGWTWARTGAEAVEILETRAVDVLSLDYDLEPGGYGCAACRAGESCDDHETGAGVVAWLVRHPGHWPREIRIHSANAAGQLRMLRALEAAGRTAIVGGRRA